MEDALTPTVSVKEDKFQSTLHSEVYHDCRVMLDFAIKNGKDLDTLQIVPLEKPKSQTNINELMGVYNYLVDVVKPALPGTLILFEKNKLSGRRWAFLGPLPIVRQFMALTLVSLVALIITSLSSQVNVETIQLSMLQGHGWDQMLRLTFLLAASSVGAAFYALFEMNNYISSGTYNPKYSSTYWSRFVLGVVAGILLSELFVVFIEPAHQTTESNGTLSSANYLLKPILAILGGFSASLVYRILNRLISAVESIFTGSANQMIAQKQQEYDLAKQANEQQLKGAAAQNLLALKQELIKNNVPQSVLNQIDVSLSQLISTPLPQEPSVTNPNVPLN